MDAKNKLDFIKKIHMEQIKDAVNLINKYKNVELSAMTENDERKLVSDIMVTGSFLDTLDGICREVMLN